MLVIVGFVSQKGGVGKSMLARALGAVAALTKIKVKIADLDPQQQTVARWEERREENAIAPHLQVGSFATAAEAVRSAAPGDELLIIDTAARANRGMLDITRNANLVVQPSGAGIDDLDPAIILFHQLVRDGVPRDRLVMALCRTANKAEEDAARAYVERAGYTVLPGAIPELSAYRDAHNRGNAVTELKAHNARADLLMQSLLAMISERVKSRVEAGKSIRGKGEPAR